MRVEKKYLVDEVKEKVSSSSYVYLTDFNSLTFAETAELRNELEKENAQFHVVKNTLFKHIAESLNWAGLADILTGQNAIVFGGKNPSGVAKILTKFAKSKSKLPLKGGALDCKILNVAEVVELSNLPDLDTLRATLLSMFLTPAKQFLYVSNAVPKGVLNVLKAYEKKKSE